MKKKQFIADPTIWGNKNIPKEAKYIYCYIYSKGFNKYITDINVGELQQVLKISNVGLRKNLKILEKFKYLVFEEYANGMYTVSINN